MSVSVMPVAYSIACDAPWSLGCVMCFEMALRFESVGEKSFRLVRHVENNWLSQLEHRRAETGSGRDTRVARGVLYEGLP